MPPIGPRAKLRPRGRWYLVFVAIGVVGLIVGGGVIVRSVVTFADRIDGFHRVGVPGTETITLDEGSYTVYFETSGGSSTFGADVAISAPNEQVVELQSYSSTVTYDVPGHNGRAVWSFRADAAGDYTVTADGRFGVVAVGPGLGRGLVSGILVGIGLILVTAVAAIVGIIVVAVRRGRSRAHGQSVPVTGWPGTVPRQPPPPPPAR